MVLLVELPPILLHIQLCHLILFPIRSRHLNLLSRESQSVFISIVHAARLISRCNFAYMYRLGRRVLRSDTRKITRAWAVVPLYIAFSERPTHFNIYFAFNRQREMARSQGYGCNDTARISKDMKSFMIPLLQRSQPASNFLHTALCNRSHDADPSFSTVVCCTSLSHSYISISAT